MLELSLVCTIKIVLKLLEKFLFQLLRISLRKPEQVRAVKRVRHAWHVRDWIFCIQSRSWQARSTCWLTRWHGRCRKTLALGESKWKVTVQPRSLFFSASVLYSYFIPLSWWCSFTDSLRLNKSSIQLRYDSTDLVLRLFWMVAHSVLELLPPSPEME